MPNSWIRKLCIVTQWVDERTDESVLRWFGQIERIGDDWIAKRVYVGDCVSSHLSR